MQSLDPEDFMRAYFTTLAVAATVLFALVLPPASAQASGRCGNHAWCDTSLSPERRADLLLAAMTPDEKIDLLGGDRITSVAVEGEHTGVQNGIPRLGVPTIYYSDGPVGPRQGKSIGLPAPLALAATFDPDLARTHGRVVATEAKFKGNDVVFAPTVNIARTPLGGRTFESYGEDPLLTSRIAVAWIKAAQNTGVIANVKHYAANNQEGVDVAGGELVARSPFGFGIEGSRMVQNSIVDSRTLREIYLPAFEAAVKDAGVGTVMCSYNRVNGPWACDNKELLQKILRNEWGFNGYTLADYLAAHNTPGNLNNGLDFEPWPPLAYQPAFIKAALASGAAPTSTVDRAVRHMLVTWFRFGVFDRPGYPNNDAQIDKQADGKASQKIAEGAATLLRNERSVLPISTTTRSIAVIGSPATDFAVGGGSGAVKPFTNHSILDGIRARAGSKIKVTYDDGRDHARAAALARRADVAIVVARDAYGEGADRGCLSLQCPSLSGNQDGLIDAVARAQGKTVVVLESGGVSLMPWRTNVAAILQAWYPGAHGGPAVARVLFGDVDPSGRLPITYAANEGQLPTAGRRDRYPGSNAGFDTHYSEGVFVGYRWYDEKNLKPAYPFGYGLSYTTFRLSGLSVTGGGKQATVRATVTNTGSRSGYAVPQLYLGLPSSRGVPQPPSALKGFTKVYLRPGESATVNFPLDRRALSYWSTSASGWRVSDGCAAVKVGFSSRDLPLRGGLPVGAGHC